MENSFYEAAELQRLGLHAVGADVRISRKASIYSPQSITIGDHVRIDDFCILSGTIRIGKYIHISAYTGIFAGETGIFLEDFVTVSGRCMIYGKTDDYSGAFMTNPMVPESLTHVTDAPVHFGKYAILGCGCTVLPGVRIGEGTAAGAMSLLNADTEPWSVYAGVPARFIHARKRDILQLAQTLEH